MSTTEMKMSCPKRGYAIITYNPNGSKHGVVRRFELDEVDEQVAICLKNRVDFRVAYFDADGYGLNAW